MNSSKLGISTSVEVTQIDRRGLWLLVRDREYFLSYQQFPWFQNARVNDILDVQLLEEDHLRWPALDVDLCLASIESPEQFPLIYH